jgi:hypothetical protein
MAKESPSGMASRSSPAYSGCENGLRLRVRFGVIKAKTTSPLRSQSDSRRTISGGAGQDRPAVLQARHKIGATVGAGIGAAVGSGGGAVAGGGRD